jgi:DNA-binding NarL/FixJ family response regulator
MDSSESIQVLAMMGNAESRLALREFLAGIQGVSLADEAINDAEALQTLSDKHVDVVLLDLSLRDVNAIELTRQIRQSHPTVRVLISTAFRRATDIFSAMDAGADGYVLKGNEKGLEVAIRTVRLGAVWLDPGIATQVLEVMVSKTALGNPVTRTLPTGRMPIPLWPQEKDLLNEVAGSSCADGVCMVDPAFIKKLRRFAPVDGS